MFQEKPYAIQLQLFYDEFETVNALITKVVVHKLGAIYFTFRDIPPLLNSKLAFIHLLALFYVPDIKTHDYQPILCKLVDDIKILSRNCC